MEQRLALRSVNLSALDLEPNLKQFEKVDGDAQGTGVEVRMWDKEATFEDNDRSLSRQCGPTGPFWCALHRPSAEALMQESRFAEAGTQGLEANPTSAIVKRKSESEQLAMELKDWG